MHEALRQISSPSPLDEIGGTILWEMLAYFPIFSHTTVKDPYFLGHDVLPRMYIGYIFASLSGFQQGQSERIVVTSESRDNEE